jgi:uncharacterized protein with NAD-binding domain and iron-sulfur cluster
VGERPTRVAVLGGGPAAMTAAFELTATPELRQRYDVTVHQLGWRLGGKGASGRNAAYGQRIEEHGLHIWFGFYNNAFAVIQRCYEELGRPAGTPLATWTDAFKPRDDCVQFERFDGEWVPHHFNLPGNPLVPGDHVEFHFWEVAVRAVGFLEREWERVTGHDHPHAQGLLERTRRLAEHHAGPAGEDHKRASLDMRIAAALLGELRDWVWKHVVAKRVAEKGLRMFFMWLDLGAALFQGIVHDDLRQRGFGAVNDEEFRAWLRRHGASELTLESSPLVRAIYDAFCYEEGDISRPNVAAGKAAQDFIRSCFLYKGALLWKMQAGMGDTIFGPFYEVLRRRGVRFEFFNCVTGLRVAPNGSAIDAIDIVRQARVRNAAEYLPLVDVEGLPCWPSEPLWDQLDDGEEMRERGVNFECDPADAAGDPVTLRRGEDFDAVVLGIPVGALGSICGELASANPRFAAMLEHSHSVMTQAFQLWVRKDGTQLGWPYSPGTLASCYVEPMDTYCDMSHLIPREDWPGDEVKHVAYFCGVLPHRGIANDAQAQATVRDNALSFLRADMARLWPAATSGDELDWSILAGAGEEKGAAAFDSQYWRANFTGSERYALTLAGSVAHRLWPDDSGFDNLVLAGDWTRNGIDGGSVEAAVTSGLLAAQAISGYPKVVKGTAGWLESDLGDRGGG